VAKKEMAKESKSHEKKEMKILNKLVKTDERAHKEAKKKKK